MYLQETSHGMKANLLYYEADCGVHENWLLVISDSRVNATKSHQLMSESRSKTVPYPMKACELLLIRVEFW